MAPTLSSAGRLAGVTAALLALIEFGWAARVSQPTLVGSFVVVGLVNLLGLVALLRWDSFMARLALGVLAALAFVVGGLSVSVGLPGQDPHRTDLLMIATVVAATAVLALLGVDCRIRRARGDDHEPPPHYAL